MRNLCMDSGQLCVKNMDRFVIFSTLSPTFNNVRALYPQITRALHNFYTQLSAAKKSVFPGVTSLLSTVSTGPTTTTTFIYKER